MKVAKYIGLLLILLLIASISALSILNNQSPTRRHRQHRKAYPDTIVYNAQYTIYSTVGQIKSQYYARQMTHYPQDDSARFVDPKAILYTQDGTPWQITAQHAQSFTGFQRFYLWGNVQIRKLTRNNTSSIVIKTSSLTIWPKKSYAKTDQKVTIVQKGTSITGTGMTFNLKTGVYKILTNVRGVYVPSNQQPSEPKN